MTTYFVIACWFGEDVRYLAAAAAAPHVWVIKRADAYIFEKLSTALSVAQDLPEAFVLEETRDAG